MFSNKMRIVLFVIVFVLFKENVVVAKRGCSNFGHSCFGGMGKRSELASENYEVVQNSEAEVDNPSFGYDGLRVPTFGYPKRLYRMNKMPFEQYDQINKIIREWVANNVRKQDESENK